MADKITINAPFSQDSRSLGRIGRVGENVSRQIVFDCTSVLTDHPDANIVCVIQRPSDKQPYAAQLVRVGETGEFKLELTSTEVAVSGNVRFELRMVDGDEILKAAICTGTVEASMSGIGDTPGEPIPDALNRLETAISEVGKYADLKAEKQDKLIAGDGITIAEDGKTISASGGGTSKTYTAVVLLNTEQLNLSQGDPFTNEYVVFPADAANEKIKFMTIGISKDVTKEQVECEPYFYTKETKYGAAVFASFAPFSSTATTATAPQGFVVNAYGHASIKVSE